MSIKGSYPVLLPGQIATKIKFAGVGVWVVYYRGDLASMAEVDQVSRRVRETVQALVEAGDAVVAQRRVKGAFEYLISLAR
jgi:hypothetical protein